MKRTKLSNLEHDRKVDLVEAILTYPKMDYCDMKFVAKTYHVYLDEILELKMLVGEFVNQ